MAGEQEEANSLAGFQDMLKDLDEAAGDRDGPREAGAATQLLAPLMKVGNP